MSTVKSFSVGNGDMFYIKHNSSNFTVIDCCLDDDCADEIINEIKHESNGKEICRFISTHPDEDHIRGLETLDEKWKILNFYCVKNEADKDDKSDSFEKYCKLRDSNKAFYLEEGCTRKWMNISDEKIDCAGINIHWPVTSSEEYKAALKAAANGECPNNISPIVRYSIEDGATFMWMGDLETEFINSIYDKLDLPQTNVLFAPHHGRDSGKVPSNLLEDISPGIIVIGEAPSKYLNYYSDYFTITQNSAGDITFECEDNYIYVYCSNEYYAKKLGDKAKEKGGKYIFDENRRTSDSNYAFTLKCND